ncbi:hypothetical protein BC941DRAFT_470147 [Chlamydoabsidia padenii]|nr:hypothetical protein BC941DRAFT_470147 [Chlamydoabsidia padenii]
MSDGRCIHCGQKGHYSMMCPKKPSPCGHYDDTTEPSQVGMALSFKTKKTIFGQKIHWRPT